MKRCLWLYGAVCLSMCACGSASSSANVAAAGAPGSAGASDAAGAPNPGGASGAGAGTGGGADQCPESPIPDASGSSGVTLPVEIFGAGAPLTTGQVVTPSTGTPYKLSLLKLYFSSPVLLKSDGTRVPAQLVQSNATPLPYGISLVDLDVPASQSLTLIGPGGDYSGLELGVGLPAACNAGDPTKRAFPLNADSDMYWTWGTQYMFIRIEGARGGEGAWSSFTLHVGFQQAYRVVRLTGGLRLMPGGGSPKVHLDVDRLLNAPSGADASGADSHEAPDEWVADNAANGALTLVP
ncbi:MAG TPA: MbnP family protein [Polyangiaceae bacterium]